MTFPSGCAAWAALGRKARERGWGKACSSLHSLPHGPHSLSMIPQGSSLFLSTGDIFSSGTSYVISFSRGIFLSLLSDMWALGFQKGSLLELGEVQPFQVYLRSMEKRGEGLSPLWQQPCYFPMPPFHTPTHQVQRMDLWTAATNWVCKKFGGVVLCANVAQDSSYLVH